MRLQLDSSVTGAAIAKSGEAGQAVPIGSGGTGSQRIGGTSSGGDSIQISGPSNALRALSADRAARVGQLTALVQRGSYQVSSSLVGRAIVADAVSAQAGAAPSQGDAAPQN